MSVTRSRSSMATTECCAVDRGRWRRRFCAPVSATGIIRSAARSSPVSGWRGTSRRREPGLMCRHLGWLGADVTVSSLVLDPPSGLRVQSYAPRRQKHGLMNADGWGVGFFEAAGPGAGAVRRRCGATCRSTRWRRRCAATAWWPRCARRPSACRSRPARRRRSPTGTGCCRTTVSSTVPCCH